MTSHSTVQKLQESNVDQLTNFATRASEHQDALPLLVTLQSVDSPGIMEPVWNCWFGSAQGRDAGRVV